MNWFYSSTTQVLELRCRGGRAIVLNYPSIAREWTDRRKHLHSSEHLKFLKMLMRGKYLGSELLGWTHIQIAMENRILMEVVRKRNWNHAGCDVHDSTLQARRMTPRFLIAEL